MNTIPKWTEDLLKWYDLHKRELPWRGAKDPYYIWVSEIMSQQTRIEAMKPYFDNWINLFPTVAELAAAEEDDVVRAWQGLGYYSRARNLRLGAQEVMDEYDGEIPRDRKSMESLKGVGSYTAGAVLSIAFNQREPAVDGNVLRVYARLYNVHEDILSTQGRKTIGSIVAETMPYDRPGDFNQALMDLGAMVCVPKTPRCEMCPLSSSCEAHALGTAQDLPIRIVKTKVKDVTVEVVLLEKDGFYLLHKRPNRGLLRSMWEFPAGEDQSVIERLSSIGITIEVGAYVTEFTHVFSHRRWHIKAYEARVKDLRDDLPSDWQWFRKEEFHTLPWAGPHGKLIEYCK